MKHYSYDFRCMLAQKVLASPERSIRSIAREANVGKSSLADWVSLYKDVIGINTYDN